MLSCPIPLARYPRVLLAHGGGGKLMHQLINDMIVPAFAQTLCESHDAAVLPASHKPLAFTADSFVVSPLFFPGGDIGSLAIYGTVNDLCMSGAVPQYLSVSFILEEGLEMSQLWQIVQSMAQAARELDVSLVTGDTKVVERQRGDGIYINTSGIGVIHHTQHIGPSSIAGGDAIIVSGDLGRHGIAVLAGREGLAFETQILSDAAPLNLIIAALLAADLEIHCLRDITRGGLAAVMNELAYGRAVDFIIEDDLLPVSDAVAAACEMLGFDPVNVACEGRFVMLLPQAQAEKAVQLMSTQSLGTGAAIIGRAMAGTGKALRNSALGIARPLEFHQGELLPRIC